MRSLLEPLIDQIANEFLDQGGEVRVGDVGAAVAHRIMAAPPAERLHLVFEAFLVATGARLERRTMQRRDLVNLSTDELGPVVARWTQERERLALERRKARSPGRALDS